MFFSIPSFPAIQRPVWPSDKRRAGRQSALLFFHGTALHGGGLSDLLVFREDKEPLQ